MPAQKLSMDTSSEDSDPLPRDNGNGDEKTEDGYESSSTPSSSIDYDQDEFIEVKLSDIRKEVQCPICLGIIRKTRTVMECLHRFCRACIDKSMRLGNNECPACRTHCASRRSLRDDPNYDSLIAAIYPDIDKYEEEESAFQEEEIARNKQIQDSIALTFKRQTEALGRKRKAASLAYLRRSQGRYRDSPLRGRKKYRNSELQGDDDDDDDGDGDGDLCKDSSSADEQCTIEARPTRTKRWTGVRTFSNSVDGGGNENDEIEKESNDVVDRLTSRSERLAWGKGGMRSHTRYGSASASGSNGKKPRNSRIFRLADHLRKLEEDENNFDLHLVLISVDEKIIPSLQQPYISCKPSMSVKQLCQYVALQTTLRANEIEICLAKESHSNPENFSCTKPCIDLSRHKLQALQEEEILAGLNNSTIGSGFLVLAYKKRFAAGFEIEKNQKQ